MKQQYTSPKSTSVCYLEPLQPLCESPGKSNVSHSIKTDDTFSNDKVWSDSDWSSDED